ncbi:histidine phosphatase family protein [Kordiimonas sp. SCSIO 12610]|uniref:SixA phosphatase family protein n=1 Tax=Kordiimonas sp. SCSIO 12610 TaxID=2829597 RepID=UPI00210AF3D6|nr:histidine phosphatase family protein [Kordiimonas sp. SCSIO 12610]UTW55293.1 histidine phosphatase family protein [Kordiimonas sp. SCSIO 12610]
MKKLYLMRHAKSDWDDFTLDDHDRPLNERGRNNATQMGQYIAKNDIQIDLIYCSTAVRTRETLKLLVQQTDLKCPKEFRADIYEASSTTLMSIIQNCPEKYKNIMLVGHNPGMHILGLTLTAAQKSLHRQQLERHLPTGTLQDITLNVDTFNEAVEDCGVLNNLVRPKTLPQIG